VQTIAGAVDWQLDLHSAINAPRWVRTTDGRTFTREIHHRRGSPENAVNRQDVERKFTSNVEALLQHASIDRLKELASQLDVLPDAGELVKILGAPFARAKAKVPQPSSALEVE